LDLIESVVAPQASRLKILALGLFPTTFQQLLFLPSDFLGAVEDIRLSVRAIPNERRYLDIPCGRTFVFQQATQLRRFTVKLALPGLQYPMRLFPSFPLPLGLPWPLLTFISLGIDIDINIAHKMLAWCTNLCECIINIDGLNFEKLSDDEVAYLSQNPVGRPTERASISLPHLRVLEVHAESESKSYLYDFMEPLHLPVLEEFNFDLYESPGWDLNSLPSLLNHNSQSSLRSKLRFLAPEESELDGIELATPLRFLTSIHVDNIRASSMMKIAYEGYFPRLTSLYGVVELEDIDLFVEMLRERWLQSLQKSDGYTGIQFTKIGARIRSNGEIALEIIQGYAAGIQTKIRAAQEEVGMLGAEIMVIPLLAFT
jgi:hypothetical protein